MNKKYDLAIIGGGPVGMFAAYFAQMHNLQTVLLESLPQLGGQPLALYPAKRILDIPVYPEISGLALTEKLTQQVAQSNVDVLTDFEVQKVVTDTDDVTIDSLKKKIHARALIIATGNGSFAPKKLPLNYNTELEKDIFYYIKDLNQFKNQQVAVFGGGDSAIDWAQMLKTVADVTVIHRRDSFRALESNLTDLRAAENVSFLTPYLPTAITQGEQRNIKVSLKKLRSDEKLTQEFDKIVVGYGFLVNNAFVDDSGISTKQGFITTTSTMATNLSGVYAVGDAITYPGRVPMIALGFGEAQIAITAIARKFFPDKKMTIHSTTFSSKEDKSNETNLL